ncbi:Crp/Fnr family transcriptional regulator [Carboxylicivirga caseinilyticus]|uniref:Crp/Fnr family transcriptional regulator n=1 Tax=Carboxylicivirga caseinilyticus TaxID=3417572 RepID=UPI002AA894AE|nr:Crp/Fnr family transcriptional regulator [uncultured Carboxylicivirga sp.]MCU4165952.1 Crp/Fnr family transcriptional regulator [Marinilabiliaceae bacterium A049]
MPVKKKSEGLDPTIKDITKLYNILSEEEKEYLLANHSTLYYKKNDIIYRESDKPTGLLCLGSGKVKIFKEGVGRREQIVRMASAPDFIGYRALFAEDLHIAAAEVIEPCIIFHVPRNVIYKLMQTNPALSMAFMKSMAKELGFARYRTVTLTQKHIRGRLAESLCVLKEVYGYEEDGETLSVYLSREDLANFSNMTTSNAIRTLTTFVNEKVLAVNGRVIKILDEDTLEKISRLG